MTQLHLFDIHDEQDIDTYIEGDNISDATTKICRTCDKVKPITDFYLDRGAVYSRCKDCCTSYRKLLNIAKKNAPEKPEHCECCGKKVDIWFCDHFPDTDKFRGWVCFECNTAAGYVGDTYHGAVKLVQYLYQRRNPE